MTKYYAIINNESDVIARIEGREFAHKVAEVADELRPENGPHGVQDQ